MGDRGSWTLGRRPALDGLRGGAILLVLGAHTGAAWLEPLGNVGVAVFFTLSGFLITGLLLERPVDLRSFYVARVRRLAPAFVVCLAVMCVLRVALGPWWLDWRAVPMSLGYVANWAPMLGIDLGPVMVLWTLSVEEQFYLVWPLLVVVMRGRFRVVVLASVLAATSLLVRVVLVAGGASWDRVMGGSDTVAFALLVGAVAVGWRLDGGVGRLRPWIAWAAVAAAVLMPALGSAWYYVVGFPLVAVLTACALWALTGDGTKLCGWDAGWLQWLGSRSYGIYLWHHPILWWMRLHADLSWPVIAAVGVPASLVVAEISYRFVEAPFRARRSARRAARPAAGPVLHHRPWSARPL